MGDTTDLATQCRHAFGREVQSRGERYQRGGRVQIAESDEWSARGSVRGSRHVLHQVFAVAEPGTADASGALEVGCDCSHFERGRFCKHLWALLIELDSTGLGPRPPRNGRVELLGASPAGSADPGPVEAPVVESEPMPALSRLDSVAAPRPRLHHVVHYVASLDRGRPDLMLGVELYESDSNEALPWKPLTVPSDEIDVFGSEDADALRALLNCVADGPATGHASRTPTVSLRSCKIPAGLQPLILPLLARTGRFVRVTPGKKPGRAHTTALRWDADTPLGVALRLVDGSRAGTRKLLVELRGAGAPGISQLKMLASGLALSGDRIVRVESRMQGAVSDFISRGPLEIESDRVPDLLDRIAGLALPMPELPVEFDWSETVGTPRGRVEIRKPDTRTPQTLLYADVSFDYGIRQLRAAEAVAGFADPLRRELVSRDTKREAALLAELEAQGLRPLPDYRDGEGDVQLLRRQLPEHADALLNLGWDVEAEGMRLRRHSSTRMSVRSGIDWFDVQGEFSFDGQLIPLPELLLAAKRGASTVKLGDGSFGLLPTEWLERLAPLAQLAETEGDSLRFLPSQALLIDALVSAQPDVDTDALFRETCERIQNAGRLEASAPPPGLRGTLREYQKVGLGWLQHMGELDLGACLADDMGLGKTLQALALLEQRRAAKAAGGPFSPSLVVVPASLVHNWIAEAERFTPQLQVLDYTGTRRAALRERFAETDLIVTTYGTLRRDIEKLATQDFDCVILDEAQAIKNSRAQISKAARLLRARQRIALSGTPVENHLGELWALFDFLNPGMLGVSARATTMADADSETVAALASALSPFILRRTKDQVLSELPPKTEQTLSCPLEGRAKRLYRELREHYRASLLSQVDTEGMGKSKIHVLEALLRLRQAACHPGLVDPALRDEPSSKLEILQEHLEQTLDEGHKALVFSQFTSLLALVRPKLDALGIDYEYLDGRTRDRPERVRRFQEDPECRVFLVSLKAGGQGLNLTAADYVFLLDPWWNPAVEAQAIDRAHRIGQSRPVFAYRLVASGTVEEKILALQSQKRDLAEAIVSGTARGVRNLTREDLELLLS